jgi:DNA primase
MSAALDLSEAAGRLKAEIFLPAVIGRTLPLKRSGRFLAAPCPFHAERTPSFYVYPDHYHCFGCGAHGDVFDWLDLTAGLTFPDALRIAIPGCQRTRGARPSASGGRRLIPRARRSRRICGAVV